MADTEAREASNVVTSSNAADFYAERLGLAEVQEEPAAVEQTEPVAEEEQLSEPIAEEEATEAEKPKDKLEKRFSKVTKRAQDAEARAEQLEARLREVEARANPQTIAQTANVNDKPQASQFDDAFEYAEALAEWSAEKALKDRDIAESQRKAEEERNKVLKSWNDKVDKAKKEMPDFNDIVSSSTVVVSDAIRDAILESDVGPQILYQIASDDDYAESLTSMSAIKALKEIGRLEAKFEAELEATPKKEAKTVSQSKAPAPISPLKGGKSAGADVLVDTNGEFYGSYAQWKAARQANRIR
jgi:hypothetical protein